MSDRPLTFLIARTDAVPGEERIDCPLYPVPEFGWSYAPLHIASDDPTAFASQLMRACDEWAQLHLEFQVRASGASSGLVWGTAAAVESRSSALEKRLAEIEGQLKPCAGRRDGRR